ncbi:MAG: imidazolonepropionase-like amidohydrolase [Candidatus Aldehydirespiratoraceae bacterium]|jgi:imidazolonepropionase-like amidohydrolase
MVDVVTGEVQSPGVVVVEDDKIIGVGSDAAPADATVIELGDRTLLPGLMDMELNFFMGGPGDRGARTSVVETPIDRSFRAVVNAKTTLLAGFTTVRNLGLFIPTGGHLLDVSLGRAIERGYVVGPRIVPAGHAICPTGGHLEPTVFVGLAHGIMPLTVEEGVANGVDEVRKAVRHQLKFGAKVIKICASGGVMSHTGPAGAQQYSDEELAVAADEAHRAGIKVAAHAHGDAGIRAAINAGIDCIEHGSLMTEDTLALAKERGTFLVATTYLADGMDVSHAAPELQAKAAEVFPQARKTISRALELGIKVCCGTDAPAIPHGQNAKELIALTERGASPLRALQTATITSAELVDAHDRGRLEPGLLADIIAVPGNPLEDISVTEQVDFVMLGGVIHAQPE